MGINKTIFAGINNCLYEYGLDSDQVQEFLNFPRKYFHRRRTKAIEIIERVLTEHGKQNLLKYVVQLAKVEHNIPELEPWVRDHVVHAVLSYLLGIYIYEHMLRKNGILVSAFQWKLAGLLHDVGYPAQVAQGILRPFTDQINKIKQELDNTRPDVYFRIIPIGIHKLSGNRNSLQMIQNWIDGWGLKIDAQGEYEKMVTSGNVCHGIISSLSVLYVIDMLYRKYNPAQGYEDVLDPLGVNWNQRDFDNEVVPACSAIFVHNIPAQCFQDARIDCKQAPLPFLLCLSDSLQDWDRPSGGDQGNPSSQYEIKIAENRLIFRVHNSERKEKIAQDISSCLVAEDIEVR